MLESELVIDIWILLVYPHYTGQTAAYHSMESAQKVRIYFVKLNIQCHWKLFISVYFVLYATTHIHTHV